MEQNFALAKTDMRHSSMSINSSNASVNSQAAEIIDVFPLHELPLIALSERTLQKLSHLLNPRKILRSEEGYERDWRGLASLSNQKFLCDENTLIGDNPTTKVIKLWCRNNPKTATFTYLEQYLGIIDRWDVSDDIYENLVEDAKTYQAKLETCTNLKRDENVDINLVSSCGDIAHNDDANILTTSDVIRAQKGLPPQTYDAFVLYADADLNYASEILTKLEDNPEYNFKLCLKDRDLLAGVQFEHVALTQLIEDRCKHLIVILTEEFLRSPENNFLVNYTHAQQIQQKTRKIVPLIYEESIVIPRSLKIYTHLRYNGSTGGLFNFWSKLATSIQNVNETKDNSALLPLSKRNDTNATLSNTCPNTLHTSAYKVNILSSRSAEIPSISIIPPDDVDKPNRKQRSKLKPEKRPTRDMINDDIALDTKHSSGQLHATYHPKTSISMCDLSTTSVCGGTRKKRKWPSKILKKVFSRSSSKLVESTCP